MMKSRAVEYSLFILLNDSITFSSQLISIILCLTVLSACVSNPVDVKKQTDKISINTNISSTQSSSFSDDYILGKVIFKALYFQAY